MLTSHVPLFSQCLLSLAAVAPGLELANDRFRPDLARTFRPGFSGVPLADRRMFLWLRSSITTSPLASAISPATWCSQLSRMFVLLLRSALTCFCSLSH